MIPEGLRAAIADELGLLELAVTPEQLLARDITLQPPGLWSPNRHCRLVEAQDGWIAVNLAREEDRDTVPAWLGTPLDADPWHAVVAQVAELQTCDLIERAVLLGLPVARVGEARAAAKPELRAVASQSRTVIDLSALWAGPLCGGLLAKARLAVTRIEDPARPDPTPQSAPGLDAWLNGGKTRQPISLRDPSLFAQIASARVLITSARSHALARLGLTPEALFSRNPALLWIAITAHGFTGPDAMRVGFGDDCAAAGGLVRWVDGEPRFLGDALADPLTGLHAARLALECLAKGQGGLLDVALAPTAARFAVAAGQQFAPAMG